MVATALGRGLAHHLPLVLLLLLLGGGSGGRGGGGGSMMSQARYVASSLQPSKKCAAYSTEQQQPSPPPSQRQHSSTTRGGSGERDGDRWGAYMNVLGYEEDRDESSSGGDDAESTDERMTGMNRAGDFLKFILRGLNAKDKLAVAQFLSNRLLLKPIRTICREREDGDRQEERSTDLTRREEDPDGGEEGAEGINGRTSGAILKIILQGLTSEDDRATVVQFLDNHLVLKPIRAICRELKAGTWRSHRPSSSSFGTSPSRQFDSDGGGGGGG